MVPSNPFLCSDGIGAVTQGGILTFIICSILTHKNRKRKVKKIFFFIFSDL